MKRLSIGRLVAAIVLPSSLLIVIALVCWKAGVPLAMITRDVAATTKMHPLTGFLSSMGILLWCAASAISLFAALTLRDRVTPRAVRFLLASGVLSAYLMLDDLLLIHETLAPLYLGIPEWLVYASIVGAMVGYLVVFRTFIVRTDVALLLLALGWFGVSLVVDWIATSPQSDVVAFLEDAAKWMGIAAWCAYHVHTAHGFLRPRMPEAERAGLHSR